MDWSHLDKWKSEEDLKKCVHRFFEILHKVEESDNGKRFRPVTISSVRVILSHELGILLPRMRELSSFKEPWEEL